MHSKIYLRDIEILRQLLTGVIRFQRETDNLIGEVNLVIKSRKNDLDSIRNYWEKEMRRREKHFIDCKRGKKQDCNAEAKAVATAKGNLQKVNQLVSEFDQVIGDYVPNRNHLISTLETDVYKTRSYLNRYIQGIQEYLSSLETVINNELIDSFKDYPTVYVNLKADSLQNSMPDKTNRFVTMAYGILESREGKRITVVASSESGEYFRPGMEKHLSKEELRIPGNGHAEAKIIEWAKRNSHKVITVGAGRPICQKCEKLIIASGGTVASSLKD